jgi:hypothetical protein
MLAIAAREDFAHTDLLAHFLRTAFTPQLKAATLSLFVDSGLEAQ